MKKNKNNPNVAGKTSRTPEMIPSMFNWLTPDFQSLRAEHLDKATKSNSIK